MLGILLLYFIGRFFYKLAEEYGKSKWGYAVLGVVTYYAGTFIYGIIYVLIYFANNPLALESDVDNDWTLRLTAIPIGIGFAYGLYYILERSWKKDKKEETGSINIDDIGKN